MSVVHPPSRPRLVFVASREDSPGCRNRDAVEDVFTAYGFTVVRPTSTSAAAQVAVLRHAEVVAGFVGSYLLLLGLCRTPKKVVVLAGDTQLPRLRRLLDAGFEHDVSVVVSTTDADGDGGFTVDPNAEGARLVEILGGLGHVRSTPGISHVPSSTDSPGP